MGVKSLWGLMKVLFPESLAECTSGAQARAACGLLASTSTTSTSAPTSKAKPNSKPRARGTAAVHVAIDVNSFLHRASFSIGGGGGDDSSTAAADKVVAAVRRKIDNILFARLESSDKSAGAAKLTVPGVSVKSLFIAVDGPPPLPKLLLQRSRRQETVKKRRTTTKALRFNSLNFTPGSLFMTRLDAALSHYAATIVARSPWIQEVIVRGSRDPGEGEVKIVKRIVTPIPTTKPTETHVHMIVTGDSDAIIQILLSDPNLSPNVVLYNPDQNILFSLPPLLKSLSSLFPRNLSPTRIRQDLALLFILAFGNDICPSIPRVPFECLWAAYSAVIKEGSGYIVDIDKSALDLRVLAMVLSCTRDVIRNSNTDGIIKVDPKLAEASMKGFVDASSSEDEFSELNNADEMEEELESSNPSQETPVLDPFDELPGVYVDLVLWTLNANATGETRDYRLFYKKSVGPSLAAWLAWLDKMSKTNQRLVYWKGEKGRINRRDPLVPGLCAVAVIPPQEAVLIPSSLHPLLEDYGAKIDGIMAELEATALLLPNVKPIDRITQKQVLYQSILDLESKYSAAQKTINPETDAFMPPIRIRHVPSVKSVTSRMDHDGSIGTLIKSLKPVVPSGGGGLEFLKWDDNEGMGIVFEVFMDGEWIWVTDVDCVPKMISNVEMKGSGSGKRKFHMPSGGAV